MKIAFSQKIKGEYGIVGHVGVGHVNSHCGFVQDDSSGFASVVTLLKKVAPLDTTISKVELDIALSSVQVTLKAGGRGKALARRGFTPAEKELAQRAVGQDATFTQNVAVHTFGRIYGQGILEVPVALQGACALAVMDSFALHLGDKFKVVAAEEANKYDKFAGTIIDIDGIPVAVLLVINGTKGGIGPDEDYEGNTNMSVKGKLMEELGLNSIPTVILECKAFIPALADKIQENKFLIRAQQGVDCTELAQALYQAGLDAQLPMQLEENMLPLKAGALAEATSIFAGEIVRTAQGLREVDSAADKTFLIATLAKLISEDAGGISFMSNSVHDKMRGIGQLPHLTAVLSMVVTKEYLRYWKIPQFTQEEAETFVQLCIAGLKRFDR